MWTIFGQSNSTCDGVSRRNLLQVGALAGGGLLLPDLLRSRAAAPASGRRTKPRQAIMIFLAGGPSHFETFDPKPDAPLEIRGPYNPIASKIPGVQFCETVPQLAKIADRFSLIRSCCHENAGHGGGQRHVQTGYPSASPEDELPHDYPAAGAYVSKVRGAMSGGMPTYMHLPNGDDGGAAFLGPAFNAFSVYSTGLPVGLSVNPNLPLQRLEHRRELRQSLDRFARQAEAGKRMDALDSLEQQAFQMLTSPTARAAFDLEKESRPTRERYGYHEAGRTFLLARRFIEAGAGIVTVRFGSWDHHGNAGGTVKSGTEENVPPLDQALSALILDLAERGLTDDVVLWCWGEFGRTPRVNNSAGRDHWPQAMSVLVSGGGFKSGVVYGATNRNGEHPTDLACRPEDVLATMYKQLDVDPARQFVNNSGRPVSILQKGAPLDALLA